MSGEVKKVDVLAAMAHSCQVLSDEGFHGTSDLLCKSHQAVAELIEACKYMSSRSDFSEWMRLHAALEAVGGTP